VTRYQWVLTVFGWVLQPVRVFVPMFYYAPVVVYYW
jgi:hypothetical protein